MARRIRFPLHYAARLALGGLCLALLACGGGKDATGPNDPPAPPGVPNQPPPPPPPPPPQNNGIIGTYTLVLINQSTLGQLVTLSNPDGKVIGLYRFDAATTLTVDELQVFSMSIQYTDDKDPYLIEDEGEVKWTGTNQEGMQLVFESHTFGDQFPGLANDDRIGIRYDMDADGQPETLLVYQRT